jgi:hypothetical protein
MLRKRADFFEQEITPEKITTLLDEIKPVLEHRQKLYARFLRKTKENQVMASKRANDPLTNLPPLILPFEMHDVVNFVSYVAGKQPVINASYDEVTKQLQ